MLKFIVAAGLLILVPGFPHGQEQEFEGDVKCGYNSCPVPEPGKLNVHLVAHTHDDVGWLKTVDQYYFGSMNIIQNAGVQYIIDSVIAELFKDPKKKFIYVETAFFWKWWREQDDALRHRVKGLVKSGQLEFIGGAWSMNDEATTHYQSVIDQFTWGFRKLNDIFGPCGQPKIGWQIDPFGHSKETASMMAHFGFDGLFFGRLDYQDKRFRMETKTMEMIWEGNPSLGPKSDIFTGALYNLYQAPRGFCFDIMCNDEPIIDDKRSLDYNVDRRVSKYLDHINWQSNSYRTEHILMTMGGDFNYQDAHYYFKNLDKLIRHVNERQKNGSRVNVFYSTPSCYLKSLNDANITWPTKKDDFFPYASDPHAYWTGYYTSRPTLKYFERLGNNLLQVCKQLSSIAHLGPEDNPDIDALREAMGILQHHDAITGTEKQPVAFDYARILHEGIKKCEIVSKAGLNKLMTKGDPAVPLLNFTSCLLTNISECSISGSSSRFVATVYNPASSPAFFYVRLPVSGKAYSVYNSEKMVVPSQVVPIPSPLIDMYGRTSTTTLELVFKADMVSPLGYQSFYISEKTSIEPESETQEVSLDDLEEVAVGDDSSFILVNTTTGLLSAISLKGRRLALNQTLEYYLSSCGVNDMNSRSSGAYIFRPQTGEPTEISKKANVTVYKGAIVSEVHLTFDTWASQVIRMYNGEDYVEVEWLVGPIPTDDLTGKEVISKFRTNLQTKGIFYTDSNGRQTIKRKRNFRPTWNLQLAEPVAGNYYPVTTDISMNDGETEVTILTDRAQGGSSLRDGELELMVHRRMLCDDGFGVDEALDEMAYGIGLIARGRHWIIAGNMSNEYWPLRKRTLQQEKVFSPHILLTDATSLDLDKWAKNYRLTYSGITEALPPNVQILTLEPWKGKSYLLRLEHMFDKSEYDVAISFSLEKLFYAFHIDSIVETALGGDRQLSDVSRLKWRKETNEVFDANEPKEATQSSGNLTVTLKPKQIRTFIVTLTPRASI